MKKDPGRYLNEEDVEGRLQKDLRKQDDIANRGKILLYGIIAGITIFMLGLLFSWFFGG